MNKAFFKVSSNTASSVEGLVSYELDALLAKLTAEFGARASEHDREASFPFENIARLHELGLLSLTVPAELGGGVPAAFGGGEATLRLAAKVVRAVAAGDASTALVLVMQYIFLNAMTQNKAWPDNLRRRVSQDAVRSGALINALRVEPDLGTPARGGLPRTIAKKTQEGWRLTGHKVYSTGSPGLTWFAVWGRSDETVTRVGTFLVHRETPGIKIVETWDHLGMRASGSHDIIFDDVLIPADHAADIREPAAWAVGGLAPNDLAWASVLVGSLYDGVAHSAREWFLSFANNRKPSNLGAALSTLPRFQEGAGLIDALLFANHALLQQAIDAVDRKAYPPARDSNLVKYLVTKNAIEAVERAIELSGNPGLSRTNPLERHYRDVICSRVHTPQNDVILASAGRSAFAAIET